MPRAVGASSGSETRSTTRPATLRRRLSVEVWPGSAAPLIGMPLVGRKPYRCRFSRGAVAPAYPLPPPRAQTRTGLTRRTTSRPGSKAASPPFPHSERMPGSRCDGLHRCETRGGPQRAHAEAALAPAESVRAWSSETGSGRPAAPRPAARVRRAWAAGRARAVPPTRAWPRLDVDHRARHVPATGATALHGRDVEANCP
jgi:hypothetical protein